MSKRIDGELGTRPDVSRSRRDDSEEDKAKGSVFGRCTLLIIYHFAFYASGSGTCRGMKSPHL
jgi:hypothetical protein